MTSEEDLSPQIPLLIAGFQGAGKSTAAKRFEGVAEIIDAELLQFGAASIIAPDSERAQRYDWKFWTGDRRDFLPAALNNAFEASYGVPPPRSRYLVLVAAILVEDWYLSALRGILDHHRPGLLWSHAEYLVLDYNPTEIYQRIHLRAQTERPRERTMSLAEVQKGATGYREWHAKKSSFPWRLLVEPAEVEREIERLLRLI